MITHFNNQPRLAPRIIVSPRIQELRDAYRTILKYRNALSELLKVDIMIEKNDRMKLVHEHRKMSEWLHEKEKELEVEFITQ